MKKFGINSIRRLIRLILGLLPNEMNKANAQKNATTKLELILL